MLFLIATSQSLSKVIWRKGRLTAVLELSEEGLKSTENTGVADTCVTFELPKTAPKHIHMP
jgi:hypothetical protein